MSYGEFGSSLVLAFGPGLAMLWGGWGGASGTDWLGCFEFQVATASVARIMIVFMDRGWKRQTGLSGVDREPRTSCKLWADFDFWGNTSVAENLKSQ